MPETPLLKVDANAPEPDSIQQAAAVIKQGGLVAFPTETVYGLGADALNESAVLKIFQAKGRPADNPLITHVSSVEMLPVLASEVSDTARKLIDKFWPGPLTLVLKRTERVAPSVSAGLSTVAVRMPANKIASALIAAAGTPIAAPSANRSGRPSPTSAEHVMQDLSGKIDLVLDGGLTTIGIESTVLDVSDDVPVVLRPGWVTPEAIEAVAGEVRTVASDERQRHSPGTRHRHYTPDATVVLIEEKAFQQRDEVIREYLAKGPVGFIGHSSLGISDSNLSTITIPNSPADYASRLYSAMRDLDARGVTYIIVEGISGSSEADAVMDRLRRAAARIVTE